MRTWIKKNEPYFRLLELMFVVVVGGFVSYLQLGISQKQTDVSEQALKVSQAELKLIELQTDLQRTEHQPYFIFDHTGAVENYSPSNFFIRNSTEGEVRAFKVRTECYLTVSSPQGERRLRLANFYEAYGTTPELGFANIFNAKCLVYPNFLGFQIDGYSNDYLKRHDYNPSKFPLPFEIHNFAELSYVTEDARTVTQRYQMQFPSQRVTPTIAEPKYDAVIDLEPFRTGEHTYDFKLMTPAIKSALVELSQGKLSDLAIAP